MQDQSKLKSRVIILGSFFVLLLLVFILSQYGRLNLSGSDTGTSFTYKLLDQSNNEVWTAKGDSRVARVIKKGKYNLQVSHNESSFFSYLNVPGFLRKTDLRYKLSAEKSRQFVGDNPAPCMIFTDKLYSYECGGGFSSIQEHVPATAAQPSYTSAISTSLNGEVESLIKTNLGTIALLHAGTTHNLYLLDNNLAPVNSLALTGLKSTDSYSALAYKDGFLAYSSNFDKVVYFDSFKAAGQEIAIRVPGDKELTAQSLSANGDTFVITYSNFSGEDSLDAKALSRIKNTAVVYSQKPTQYDYSGQRIVSAVNCGTSKLCLLNSKGLSVYKLGQTKHPIYIFPGVKYIDPSSDGNISGVSSSGILHINADRGTGFLDYTFDDYKFCGFQPIYTSKYLLCLISGDKKTALLIDRASENSGSVDKKVQALSKMAEVSDLSVYGKYIFITPSLGPLVYSEAAKGYTYDPETKKAVNGVINERLKQLGIDIQNYTIINTSE
jgi:hypothetical protein